MRLTESNDSNTASHLRVDCPRQRSAPDPYIGNSVVFIELTPPASFFLRPTTLGSDLRVGQISTIRALYIFHSFADPCKLRVPPPPQWILRGPKQGTGFYRVLELGLLLSFYFLVTKLCSALLCSALSLSLSLSHPGSAICLE